MKPSLKKPTDLSAGGPLTPKRSRFSIESARKGLLIMAPDDHDQRTPRHDHHDEETPLYVIKRQAVIDKWEKTPPNKKTPLLPIIKEPRAKDENDEKWRDFL